jgi:hypothetical protein
MTRVRGVCVGGASDTGRGVLQMSTAVDLHKHPLPLLSLVYPQIVIVQGVMH